MTPRPEQFDNRRVEHGHSETHSQLHDEAYGHRQTDGRSGHHGGGPGRGGPAGLPNVEISNQVTSHPESHSNSDARATSGSQSGAWSDSRSGADSHSNSSATGGDAHSNSSATGGDSTSSSRADGGHAAVGDTSANASGGQGGQGGNVYFRHEEKVQAPDVYTPTVIPGAPAATGFSYDNGRRVYSENSNATTDTTSGGFSLGTGSIGIGFSFGASRPAEMGAVRETQQREAAAFGAFIADTVDDADPNLRGATGRLRRGVVDAARRQLDAGSGSDNR